MKPAFTLVELLIVIAILGLLSVLAFPGLRQTLVMGDRGRDISNLRQIGTALLSYAADNHNNFPAAIASFLISSSRKSGLKNRFKSAT